MSIFDLNNGCRVICEWKSRRGGFKHEATMIDENNQVIAKTKICYINRTWEGFQFQSVLNKICNQVFKKNYNEMRGC